VDIPLLRHEREGKGNHQYHIGKGEGMREGMMMAKNESLVFLKISE